MNRELTVAELRRIPQINKQCTCQNNGDYCKTCYELIDKAEESSDSIEQVYLRSQHSPAYYMRHYAAHRER